MALKEHLTGGVLIIMSNKHAKTAWVSRSYKTDTPWGHEIIWTNTTAGHGKVLFLKEDKRTSLKYNMQKDEAFLIFKGSSRVYFGDENSIVNNQAIDLNSCVIKEGDVLNVQSGCPYRFHALCDTIILEIGNKLNTSPIRLEDDYGRGIFDKMDEE